MAGVAAVAARHQVEMEMVAVVPVVAGAEHGREILAAVRPHIVEEAAGAEGEQARLLDVDVASACKLDAADVDGIALRVGGHGARAVDAAAGVAGELMDSPDPAPVAQARGRVELVTGPSCEGQ